MNKEKLKLTTNVPCTFTLENAQGKETTSKFHDGVEYMYSVTCRGSSSILFLPVDGNLAIKRSGARAGDQVELLKELHNNRPVFSARLVGSESAETGLRMQPPQTQVRQVQPPTPVAPAATPQARVAEPVSQKIATVHPLEEMMQRCFIVAGRALWNGFRELKAAGCAYDTPTIEDVRAAGISMFIERQRGTR